MLIVDSMRSVSYYGCFWRKQSRPKVFPRYPCFLIFPQSDTDDSLHGLFGRKTGQVEGFQYTDANKQKGIVWYFPTASQSIPKATVSLPFPSYHQAPSPREPSLQSPVCFSIVATFETPVAPAFHGIRANDLIGKKILYSLISRTPRNTSQAPKWLSAV